MRPLARAMPLGTLVLAAGWVQAEDGKTYTGQAVRIGKGTAQVIVRADAAGKPVAIGVRLTEAVFEALPQADKANPHGDFSTSCLCPPTPPKRW